MARRWHSLACALGLALLAVQGAAAESPALPQPLKLVAAVVPADGVVGVGHWASPGVADGLKNGSLRLHVSDSEGQAIAGTTLAGGLSYFAAFQPDAPFPVGAPLTLRLLPRDADAPPVSHGEWTPLQFSATGARGADAPFPEGSIVVELEDRAVTAGGCCESACFDTYRRTGVRANLTASIDGSAAAEGQYVYAFAPQGEPGRSWSVEAWTWIAPTTAAPLTPFEPCQSLWAHALATDEERELASTCVDETSLVPEREEFLPLLDDQLAFEVCKQPSVELRMRWCAVNRDACAGDATACPGYAWTCVSQAATPQAGAGSSAPMSSRRSEEHEPSCAAAPRSTRKPGLVAFLLAAALLRSRRVRTLRSRLARDRLGRGAHASLAQRQPPQQHQPARVTDPLAVPLPRRQPDHRPEPPVVDERAPDRGHCQPARERPAGDEPDRLRGASGHPACARCPRCPGR